MSAIVELDRRFIEWTEGNDSDPELSAVLGRAGDGSYNWPSLILRRRVVALAEAGSGKTEELKEQARRQTADGKFAFYATVQDVGRRGLKAALTAGDQTRLTAWYGSTEDAWFFIDSVDEAKLDGIRLDQALREVASGIHGHENRAHVVLSGRYTDWEFRRDLKRFDTVLPILPEAKVPEASSPDELLIKILRREHQKTETERAVEKPLVVIMQPLDPDRVKRFAVALGAPDVDKFVSEIESRNLWRFARRPRDLEWMVQYWVTHHRLGSLCEMIEASLKARLAERDADRARIDNLDLAHASPAIERIGGALVLGRARTIAIPDSELTSEIDLSSISLEQLLPDWTPANRERLFSRATFDPATFGRARFHNDNEGDVSAYLAARWLQRLRGIELSRQGVFDLLFAEQYGLDVIKPSMRETAGWLAIWDPDVAREVVRRDTYMLLTAGDPASLPSSLRSLLLTRLADATLAGEPIPLLDADGIRRFARADLSGLVRSLWDKHKSHAEIRSLVLRLTWLGELVECADIVIEAAFATYADNFTALVAGRALIAIGNDADKRKYVSHVLANLGALRPAVVWYAVEHLFPDHMSVDDLLTIVGSADVTNTDGGLGFEYSSPKAIERLSSAREVEKLVIGLMGIIGVSHKDIDKEATKRERAFFPAISAAAGRLLELAKESEAPSAAIDAVVRLGTDRYERRSRKALASPAAALTKTAARRRLALWRASELLTGHPTLRGRPLESIWELEILGFSPHLQLDDLDWLLRADPSHATDRERRLAVDAALKIWHDNGQSEDMLKRIKDAVAPDAIMQAAFDMRRATRVPSANERELEEKHRRHVEEQDRLQQEEDKWWFSLVAKLRADPTMLRGLIPEDGKSVDSRLHALWHLLSLALDRDGRYAIDTVAPLEPIIGPEAAATFKDALISHWRHWTPRLHSEREPEKRNIISQIDCMGIVGVTLEAVSDKSWATRLTKDEAKRAVAYATIELNGFPFWIRDLASAWPEVVRDLLMTEIGAALDHDGDAQPHEVLQFSARFGRPISSLLASPMLDELRRRPDLAGRRLVYALDIIVEGLSADDRQDFCTLALSRFEVAKGNDGVLYLAAAFRLDPARAVRALDEKLDTLSTANQTLLAQAILPELFGDGWSRKSEIQPDLPFPILERLVEIAYRTIRVSEDHRRPDGVVFSPDARDNAESARGNAFQILTNTPGRPTYDALLRLARKRDFPIAADRLRLLAAKRAAEDSESPPWSAANVIDFEQTSSTTPNTTRDLQRVAQSRLFDIQYDLLNGDFAQGKTVQALRPEQAVQNWIADRLRTAQGRSYSVEREPHVVEEKEPDVRLRAKSTDASLPIEIKVPESWTLPQLEHALKSQLCGRYLRARDGRDGILLLVYQQPRARGWKKKNGKSLSFTELVAHLKSQARAIAVGGPDAPQPEIAVIDVSSLAKRTSRRKAKKVVKTAAKTKKKPAPTASRSRKVKSQKRAVQTKTRSHRGTRRKK